MLCQQNPIKPTPAKSRFCLAFPRRVTIRYPLPYESSVDDPRLRAISFATFSGCLGGGATSQVMCGFFSVMCVFLIIKSISGACIVCRPFLFFCDDFRLETCRRELPLHCLFFQMQLPWQKKPREITFYGSKI